MNANQAKMWAIILVVAFATKERWLPYVLEDNGIDDPPVVTGAATVNDYYTALAKVIERDQKNMIKTTGDFRRAHQASAQLFQQTESIPTVDGRRNKISQKLVDAIGLEDRAFTDELRASLVIALNQLGEEL